jgi:hypothetical protein
MRAVELTGFAGLIDGWVCAEHAERHTPSAIATAPSHGGSLRSGIRPFCSRDTRNRFDPRRSEP